MPPPKVLRTRGTTLQNVNEAMVLGGGPKKALKRKAETSPTRNDKVKRSALGNLTNNVANGAGGGGNKENSQQTQMVAQRKRGALEALQTIGGGANIQPSAILQQQPKRTTISKAQNNGAAAYCANVLAANTKLASVAKASAAVEQQIAAAAAQAPRRAKVMTRAQARASHPDGGQEGGTVKTVQPVELPTKIQQLEVPAKPRRRISNEFEKSKADDDSLYMSALESSCSESERLSIHSNASCTAAPPSRRPSSSMSVDSALPNDISTATTTTTTSTTAAVIADDQAKAAAAAADAIARSWRPVYDTIVSTVPPPGVPDFDLENWDDPFQASEYAMDIFNYLKKREDQFVVSSYMEQQVNISRWMRSLLVDWMVEVQETFELNHETLYLAVKVVDRYLGKKQVIKDRLQLLGAAALFVSCKYDERTPPMIDDFLYICDGAYSHKDLIHMEMDVFRTIGYDLGIPLSYRFLRRYARCAKVPMTTLTLARFILEFSLMDYATVTIRDSKLASAALFMALRMSNQHGWDNILEYYSGYKIEEFAEAVVVLNAYVHMKPREATKTVRNKYSHKIFFEVAKTPLMNLAELFANSTVKYDEFVVPATSSASSLSKK